MSGVSPSDYIKKPLLMKLRPPGPNDSGMSLHEFISKHSQTLPLIVYVTEGYLGDDVLDFEFSSGDLFLVTHVLEQKRVILQDSFDQSLSFPADHSLHFLMKDSRGDFSGSPLSLLEILEKIGEPTAGEEIFLKPHLKPGQVVTLLGEDKQSVPLDLNPMTYIKSYDERYIVGSNIVTDTLYRTSHIIPLFMPIRVQTINDLVNNDRFSQLMQELRAESTVFAGKNKPGHKHIIMLDNEDVAQVYKDHYDLLKPSNKNYKTLPVNRNTAVPNEYRAALPARRQHNTAATKQRLSSPERSHNKGENQPYSKTRMTLERTVGPSSPGAAAQARTNQRPLPRTPKLPPLPDTPPTDGPYEPLIAAGGHRNEEREDNISGLSVEKVGHLLKDLKLDDYVQKFEEEGVDGTLLASLKESDLRELIPSGVAVRKLMLAIEKNWRPKHH